MFLWPTYWTIVSKWFAVLFIRVLFLCVIQRSWDVEVSSFILLWKISHGYQGDLTTPHWTTISWVCTRTENETCCVMMLLKRTASLQLLGRLFEAAEALQGPRAGINFVNHFETTLMSCMTEYITFVCNYTISPSQGCMLLCEQEALAHYFP